MSTLRVGLRLGTRASALALWQARHVAAAIARIPNAPAVEIVEIRTTGDAVTDVPLWAAPGKGLFTAELDRALLDNRVDMAVHSLKDLPTTPLEGLALTAVLEREDARDALVVRTGFDPHALPQGASVGTSSLRRRAFITRWRPDLTHRDLRGNVPTRLAKLDEGAYDAIVLAAAGLKRLDLGHRISTYLPLESFPPAVAQGAIAVVTRDHDDAVTRWIAALDHAATRVAVTAERALLRHLEGGCQIPLGGHAQVVGGTIRLHAEVCAVDGSFAAAADAQGPLTDPERLGVAVAETLLKRDARRALATMPTAAPRMSAP
jgi:hydroxymethylbilane synthase